MRYYKIRRRADGLLYAGYDDAKRCEVWKANGYTLPEGNRHVYIASLRPELYELVLITNH